MSDGDILINLPADDADGDSRKIENDKSNEEKAHVKKPVSYYFPSRGNVDSWATRIGALAVIQTLFSLISDTALVFAFVGAIVLFILSLLPLVAAWDEVVKADAESENIKYTIIAILMLLSMLFVSVMLMFPELGFELNTAIKDHPYITGIVSLSLYALLYTCFLVRHMNSEITNTLGTPK